MDRRSNGAIVSGMAGYAGLVFLLTACDALWNAPEDKAQEFVETLVVAPAETSRLREIANLPAGRNPEDLIDGLSARVALDFLRARQAQGGTLKFAQGETRRSDDARRTVTIRIAYAAAGGPVDGESRFQVSVERDEQGRWRITRVSGGN